VVQKVGNLQTNMVFAQYSSAAAKDYEPVTLTGNVIGAKTFPSRMSRIDVILFLRFPRWPLKTLSLGVQLYDPDGSTIGEGMAGILDLEAEGWPPGLPVDSQYERRAFTTIHDAVIPRPGVYFARAFVEGNRVGEAPLYVVRQR
jgi:hypothetical protein